jgi:N-acetylglutamate synthase
MAGAAGILMAMPASIAEVEAVAARGWRAPEEARLGGWLLRAAEGFTGRANSALAVGDPGLPLADALTRVCDWYAARGLPPMVAVPHPLGRPGDSHVDRFLDRRGWGVRPGPAVVMMTAATAGVARGPAADAELRPEPDQAWLDLYHGYRGQLPPVARRLLLSAPFQAFASIRRGGTVAIGRVAVAAGWGGLSAVAVHPGHRRSGLAAAITAALAEAAAGQDAARLYLQVEEDNTPAIALYTRRGFTGHHRYHYRIAPAVLAWGSDPPGTPRDADGAWPASRQAPSRADIAALNQR